MRIELDALDRRTNGPLYKQLKQLIRGAILAGTYKPGQRIEKRAEFMADGHLSNRTVFRAFKELADEGYVVRRGRGGTFVAGGRHRAPGTRTEAETIAVMFKEPEVEMYVRIARGVERECDRHGYRWISARTGWEEGDEDRVVHELTDRKVTGFVAIPDMAVKGHRELIRAIRDHLPVVLVNDYMPEIACDVVMLEGEDVYYQLARHLLELGHTKIVFLSTHFKYPYGTSVRTRLAGLHRALDEWGLQAREEDVVVLPPGREVAECTRKATADLLNRPAEHRPTAIMCTHDGLARLAIQSLRGLGVRVPQDMSVTGCDDMSYAKEFNPPLTTACSPFELMGAKAASLFFERLCFPHRQPIHVVLGASVAIRGSTGPPCE